MARRKRQNAVKRRAESRRWRNAAHKPHKRRPGGRKSERRFDGVPTVAHQILVLRVGAQAYVSHEQRAIGQLAGREISHRNFGRVALKISLFYCQFGSQNLFAIGCAFFVLLTLVIVKSRNKSGK